MCFICLSKLLRCLPLAIIDRNLSLLNARQKRRRGVCGTYHIVSFFPSYMEKAYMSVNHCILHASQKS